MKFSPSMLSVDIDLCIKKLYIPKGTFSFESVNITLCAVCKSFLSKVLLKNQFPDIFLSSVTFERLSVS